MGSIPDSLPNGCVDNEAHLSLSQTQNQQLHVVTQKGDGRQETTAAVQGTLWVLLNGQLSPSQLPEGGFFAGSFLSTNPGCRNWHQTHLTDEEIKAQDSE